jgi:hypothetical protein
MEDDDDNNKAGLIDITTVAINNTHNSVGDAAAAPNADELIEAAQAGSHLAINQNSQCNCVYLQTMRTFRNFADSQRDLGVLDAGPTYFMGQNIDLFFAHVMHIQPKSAKQYVQALNLQGLNWFALRHIYTLGEVPVIGQLA